MSYRVGIGYDIHRLVDGRKLFVGAVEIPYEKGLLGHSDADVLLHALCDALLGAAGESDIGQLFPDTDPKYRGISSLELLKTVDGLIKKKNFLINNIDTVVIAEEPKLFPFKKQMQEKIAGILKIKPDCVNIKAKTAEGLGEIGQKAAIACFVAVTIMRKRSASTALSTSTRSILSKRSPSTGARDVRGNSEWSRTTSRRRLR